ncbi:MAG: SHOCT domain-containing protein [Streptomycetaceae bacterium]|nr:SHOCT domain-containing protein [Streptomycetaceae bacterium]
MFWSDHDVSGWGWFVMSLGMVAFWAAVITVAVLLFRALGQTAAPPAPPQPAAGPESLLAERFARGEIDEDEYRRRLAVLRRPTGPPGKA